MKFFFRSISYLKPYRLRLAISVVAVLFLAVLWGGGLGMLLPGMNILIAPEGLHGWAWNSMTKDRMNAFLVRRVVPPDTIIDGQAISIVLDVVDPYEDGRAIEGGIRRNDWLVGLVTPDGSRRFMRGDVLVRELALRNSNNRIVDLLVYSPHEGRLHVRKIKLHRLRFASRMLGRIVQSIDEPETRRGRTPMWFGLIVIILVVTILRNFFRFIQEYLVETAVQHGMWDLRSECYNVALRQPVTFFAAQGTTDTMSRFVQDTTELSRAQTTLFGKTLAEPAKAIASITMALIFSWKLTLVAMVGGPVVYVIIRAFGKIMRKSTRRALESWSDMLAVLEETLTGIRVVKAYTMEAAERKRFFRVNHRLYRQQRRMARVGAATSPTVEVIGMCAGMLAAGGAGYLVLHDRMDPYLFLSWMGCLAAMFDPVRKLSKVVTRFQRGDAAAERIFELHDRQQERLVPGAPMLPRHSKSIEFAGVSYRYPATEELVLKDVNLRISAGQAVAIVGPNGSGKTTLVSLLDRLLEPTEGKILLDDRDIAAHSLRSLRRQIGIVTQETVIFNATIAENISYGRRRADRQQILGAAQKAFVDEFVREMPEGYDTKVGQRGATLSGGQRQRIAIARAILRDPAILIFDEALSQIDADSEHRIQKAMRQFMQGRTTFMIAHRFSTVLSADMIIVMNEGRIVDTGKHQELLQRCELYRHLYNTQFAEAGQ